MAEIGVSGYQIFNDANSTVNSLKTSLSDYSTKIASCKNEISQESVFMGPICDNCCDAIAVIKKDCDSEGESLTAMSTILTTVNSNYAAGDSLSLAQLLGLTDSSLGDGVVTASILGSSYALVNTKGAVLDYWNNVIKGNKIYQASGNYADQCLGFAFNHAWGLYTNDTGVKAKNCSNGTAVGGNFKEYSTQSESEYLEKLYEQLSQGKPVVIQVVGKKSSKSRHYVTCVGFNSNVKSAKDLKATDLIIIDSYDGQMENLVPYGTGGSNRYLIKGTQTGNGRTYGYQMYYIK